jgi:hypothetical protein
MKSITYIVSTRSAALLLAAATLAGCAGAVKQESAMEWMARQPTFTR